MSDVMLSFGTVQFSVTEAAYQTLRRAAQFRLPALQHIGTRPGYQFTGPGEESIALAGTIMPTYRGRPGVLDDLRALAAEGRPQTLTSGRGEGFGRWMLAEVNEERSGLFSDGQARKIAFTARFLRDSDEPGGQLTGLEQRADATGSVAAGLDAMGAAVRNGQSSQGAIDAFREGAQL